MWKIINVLIVSVAIILFLLSLKTSDIIQRQLCSSLALILFVVKLRLTSEDKRIKE